LKLVVGLGCWAEEVEVGFEEVVVKLVLEELEESLVEVFYMGIPFTDNPVQPQLPQQPSLQTLTFQNFPNPLQKSKLKLIPPLGISQNTPLQSETIA
jgi:hypothetical protein